MRFPVFGLGILMAAAPIPPLQAATSLYRVMPRALPMEGRVIVHDIAWRCASGTCTAVRTGSSTDATVCAAVARDLGPLAVFVVDDAGFDAAALEKCNRRAR